MQNIQKFIGYELAMISISGSLKVLLQAVAGCAGAQSAKVLICPKSQPKWLHHQIYHNQKRLCIMHSCLHGYHARQTEVHQRWVGCVIRSFDLIKIKMLWWVTGVQYYSIVLNLAKPVPNPNLSQNCFTTSQITTRKASTTFNHICMDVIKDKQKSSSEMSGLWLRYLVFAQNLPQISAKMASQPAKSQPEKLLHCAIMIVWMPCEIYKSLSMMSCWLWLGFLVQLRFKMLRVIVPTYMNVYFLCSWQEHKSYLSQISAKMASPPAISQITTRKAANWYLHVVQMLLWLCIMCYDFSWNHCNNLITSSTL